MIVIGIGGKAHSGKDTAADFLVEKYGFVKVAFADALKEMIHKEYHIPKDQLWCDVKTPYVRKLLQDTGERARQQNPGHWVDLLWEKITKGNYGRVVIPDVRHVQERKFVEYDMRGVSIEIIRTEGRPIEHNPDHISEQKMRDWDYIIHNDGSKEELFQKIENMLKTEEV
ncbi:MAG: hypothetical protein KAS66_08330 [Candidatus Omnitrophica bacterium]|nr:hypothetical protein [Candidatus Omnitrophota bacterium]